MSAGWRNDQGANRHRHLSSTFQRMSKTIFSPQPSRSRSGTSERLGFPDTQSRWVWISRNSPKRFQQWPIRPRPRVRSICCPTICSVNDADNDILTQRCLPPPPLPLSTHGVGTPPSPCLTSTRRKELGMVGREGWGGDATRVQKPHLSVAALTIFFFLSKRQVVFLHP